MIHRVFLGLLGACHLASALGDGVNLQPEFTPNGDVTFGWELMKQYPQIKSVRIHIRDVDVGVAKNWIAQAAAQGYEIVATYHMQDGSDDPNTLQAAANWWVANYATLRSAGDFTINMMNEWGSHSQTKDSFASAYNQAIATVRKVYSGYIIVDIPGWGQEARTASLASPAIQDKFVVFSAHIYPNGWNQGAGHSVIAADMDELKATGRPCMIGEYGTSGSGDVDVIGVVNHAKAIGFWSVQAWAWNGDGSTPPMNMVSPSWYQNPKASSYTPSDYWDKVFGPIKSFAGTANQSALF